MSLDRLEKGQGVRLKETIPITVDRGVGWFPSRISTTLAARTEGKIVELQPEKGIIVVSFMKEYGSKRYPVQAELKRSQFEVIDLLHE